jgi:hypothetical protein
MPKTVNSAFHGRYFFLFPKDLSPPLSIPGHAIPMTEAAETRAETVKTVTVVTAVPAIEVEKEPPDQIYAPYNACFRKKLYGAFFWPDFCTIGPEP